MREEGAAQKDVAFMDRALDLARTTRPSPNPPVGAVVVSASGEAIGLGIHRKAGGDHAEIEALREAGEGARGGTLFVTLEPCNHHGRTPPCVDAVIGAGVRRVVIGCLDPNPHVDGGGAEKLRAAGIEVVLGASREAAQTLIRPWATYITTGIPHVSVKLALSLDGRIATRTGASKWVTGPEARLKVQALRANSDAVAVGVRTVEADDPALNVRDIPLVGAHPRRVVFDSRLRISLHARLVLSANEVPTTIVTTTEAPEEVAQALTDAGCEVLRLPATAEGRVDVDAALRALASLGVVSLLVEGGAELAGSMLATHSAHELHAFLAPILLGPRGRPGAVDWAGPDTPNDAPRIVDPVWECVGNDAYVYGLLVFPPRG